MKELLVDWVGEEGGEHEQEECWLDCEVTTSLLDLLGTY